MVPSCSPARNATASPASWISGRYRSAASARSSPSRMRRGHGYARTLVERLLDEATHEGAEVGLLFSALDATWCDRNGFEKVPLSEAELGVAQSPRHGAPMTLVRGGEAQRLGGHCRDGTGPSRAVSLSPQSRHRLRTSTPLRRNDCSRASVRRGLAKCSSSSRRKTSRLRRTSFSTSSDAHGQSRSAAIVTRVAHELGR